MRIAPCIVMVGCLGLAAAGLVAAAPARAAGPPAVGAPEPVEPGAGPGVEAGSGPGEEPWAEEAPPWEEAAAPAAVADPLEPINRAVFAFNDKVYFWFLKPVARGYAFVVPKPARNALSRLFHNVAAPIRFANCLFQLRPVAGARVLGRFVVNSTVGVAGLFDPAGSWLHLRDQEEDFGQTLGAYGAGHGFYLVLPLLGPSSLRDGIGLAGDVFLDPLAWVLDPWQSLAWRGAEVVNRTSLEIGQYEDIKRHALDPYLTIRDGYAQYRAHQVEE
ncbi:VacJ family lipoprotein [Dissulfurirhabdus thermomarina]|uniref:VacJ family lipoprotein n=1 Tax=Dissulfurirhabdus thermomarina TaxID=1765737 RepID=A0A6N9TNU6_DISTH|nr:VacJ family lipoprotein [Dissulfurirhabdus thermomarina]NDY42961.1 VacJ family lipoprotein [Dissulfurirhabdus thermomarina]NMX24325.1 VacJ family lipoprotein [Dissulfurirhabdus thermomarina]